MTNWNKRFIDLSDHISLWSKDTIKVGCIITSDKQIVATGYNGMPSWFDDSKLFDLGSEKNTLITHAEINALGCISIEDHKDKELTLYVNRPPCLRCANLICNSIFNITKIYYTNKTNKEHTESLKMFDRFNISYECLTI